MTTNTVIPWGTIFTVGRALVSGSSSTGDLIRRAAAEIEARRTHGGGPPPPASGPSPADVPTIPPTSAPPYIAGMPGYGLPTPPKPPGKPWPGSVAETRQSVEEWLRKSKRQKRKSIRRTKREEELARVRKALAQLAKRFPQLKRVGGVLARVPKGAGPTVLLTGAWQAGQFVGGKIYQYATRERPRAPPKAPAPPVSAPAPRAAPPQPRPAPPRAPRAAVTTPPRPAPAPAPAAPPAPRPAPAPAPTVWGSSSPFPAVPPAPRRSTLTLPSALDMAAVYALLAPRPAGRLRDRLTVVGQGDPLTQPQPAGLPSGMTPFGPGRTGTCECKPKRKGSGKRKRRTTCYKGSYQETATGLRKRKRERVPC